MIADVPFNEVGMSSESDGADLLADVVAAWPDLGPEGHLTPLTGGDINDVRSLRTNDGTYVLRRYLRDRSPGDLLYELSAVEFLHDHGFPTPRPHRTAEGALSAVVGGRRAAVFDFIEGRPAEEREGGYGSLDIELGLTLASYAARMHILTAGHTFAGERSSAWVPHVRVAKFAETVLDADLESRMIGIGSLVAATRSASTALAAVLEEGDLPRGLVHGDLRAANFLVSPPTNEIVAVIDFDDCYDSYLLYDLCSLISYWGLDEDRKVDIDRVRPLVAAYNEVRPLTHDERRVLPWLLMAYFGAEGTTVVNNMLNRSGRGEVSYSYSVGTFVDFLNRPELISQVSHL